VSSHTVRSDHTHQRALLKTTDVSCGTIVERGSIFTSGSEPENPPKRYLVKNVHSKNYLSLLAQSAKNGNCFPEASGSAYIPRSKDRCLSPRFGKHVHSAIGSFQRRSILNSVQAQGNTFFEITGAKRTRGQSYPIYLQTHKAHQCPVTRNRSKHPSGLLCSVLLR